MSFTKNSYGNLYIVTRELNTYESGETNGSYTNIKFTETDMYVLEY